MEFRYDVKIPKARVAVLLGVKGLTKRDIENKLKIKLEVDSKTGEIELVGDDSLKLIMGQNIVRAIGRGFNPIVALGLLKEDFVFESLDITDFVGDKKNNIVRARSRCIGEQGKARKTIEYLSETKVVIYGKTISIIGNYEGVSLARKGFEGLLEGQRHSTVYAWLEKQRKKFKFKI